MKGYSLTDTIILWSENKEIVKYTNDIAKELNVQVYVPDHIVDLVAIPCFLIIVDSKILAELVKQSGPDTMVNEYFYYSDCKILVTDKFKFNVPWPLNNLVEEMHEIVSKKLLFPIIKSNLDFAIRENEFRKKQFKKRIFRILTLYHLDISGKNIDLEKLAFRYDTSLKTIDRDFGVLKIINPNQNFFLLRNGYKNEADITNFHNVTAKKSTKVLSLRQKALINQVKRLIDLYQMLKNGLAIKVDSTCEQYKITDRTLRRDIKLLSDVNPTRKIRFDKIKGYY